MYMMIMSYVPLRELRLVRRYVDEPIFERRTLLQVFLYMLGFTPYPLHHPYRW